MVVTRTLLNRATAEDEFEITVFNTKWLFTKKEDTNKKTYIFTRKDDPTVKMEFIETDEKKLKAQHIVDDLRTKS